MLRKQLWLLLIITEMVFAVHLCRGTAGTVSPQWAVRSRGDGPLTGIHRHVGKSTQMGHTSCYSRAHLSRAVAFPWQEGPQAPLALDLSFPFSRILGPSLSSSLRGALWFGHCLGTVWGLGRLLLLEEKVYRGQAMTWEGRTKGQMMGRSRKGSQTRAD